MLHVAGAKIAFIIRSKSPHVEVHGPFDTREAAQQYAKAQYIRLDNNTRIEEMVLNPPLGTEPLRAKATLVRDFHPTKGNGP